ncbi:hypothetical protein JOM56_008927 [Amanita muscaria]
MDMEGMDDSYGRLIHGWLGRALKALPDRQKPTGINEDGRANTNTRDAILFVMDQTQYSASGSIMPLETRDFDSYINVLEANEALAHFINEWYASDEGYEAVKKDNAADKRDRAE